METLICQQCNAEKPVDQFTLHRKDSDRRRPYCKACHAAQEKWYRDQRRAILGADHPLLQPSQPKPRVWTEEPPEKTCAVCRITKPLSELVWADKHHRRHRNLCMPCNALKQAAHRDNNRIKAMQPRMCTDCQITKPAEEFHWRIRSQWLLQPICKPCAAVHGHLQSEQRRTVLGEEGLTEYHKNEYQKSREKQLAYHKEYYAENKEKLAVKSRAYYEEHRDRALMLARHRRLKHYFGLTIDDYNAMALQQNNLCALCGNNPKKLLVDHCHITGAVRGLLCVPCNSFLGRIHDSIETLDKIKDYLLRHRPT